MNDIVEPKHIQGCYVQFRPTGSSSLERTAVVVRHVAEMKRQAELTEEGLRDLLSTEQLAYFWDPSPEEAKEWNAYWFGTPLPQRHSPEMPSPGWDFGSCVDSLADGEYEIKGVDVDGSTAYLMFDPFAYPFGGTGCMVALVESLGNEVLGIQDGTGFAPYVPPKRWKPGSMSV